MLVPRGILEKTVIDLAEVSLRVLKTCPPQLCGVLKNILNRSLLQDRVFVGWKTSCLVAAPKVAWPTAPCDYRPVELTSHIMKVFGRLVLESLRPMVKLSSSPSCLM